MEANDYALLFQPSDLVTKANASTLCLWPNAAVKVNVADRSEGDTRSLTHVYIPYHPCRVKVNVADRVVKDVEKQMKENNITNFLFVNAQKDIVRAQCHHRLRVCILSLQRTSRPLRYALLLLLQVHMFEQDLFPRYEEWCDQEGVKQPQSSARNTVGLLDRSRGSEIGRR